MFSRSYHHHQDTRGATGAPAAHCSGWAAHPNHYNRLESLLDSALATLALLHESHTAPAPLAFSPHVSEVLSALNKYIVVNQAPHPNPTPDTTTTSEPLTEACIAQTATYALAAASPPPSSNTDKHTPVATPSRATPPVPNHIVAPRTGAIDRARSRASRLILRFDPADPVPPKRADTLELYAAVANVLPKQAYHLAGVSWTRKGTLVLHARPGVCTAKLLAVYEAQIWGALRPRLGFNTKKAAPKFEVDEPWYSIVIHGAPMPPSRSPEAISLLSIMHWSEVNGLTGSVMAYSILCSADDFETRDSLSVRVSLSSEADALHLVKNGGTFFGAMCRVSRYIPKSPRCSPSC
ncbi:hypothetical protein C8R45DRAFT_1157374 [Mycena sanguinolenta]|nr:hypothetical protein C8R45DRAFT_1157374 [Mycena sanguinolenta]